MSYRNSPNTSRNSANPLTAEELAMIENLYAKGESDNAIAVVVGVSSKTVSRWRAAEGLERPRTTAYEPLKVKVARLEAELEVERAARQ